MTFTLPLPGQYQTSFDAGGLRVIPIELDAIPRACWDRLYRATPAASPFSRWTVHRAWWDAYAEAAEPHYLLCIAADEGDSASAVVTEDAVRAIIPLMRRTGPAEESVMFFAASYHADYATVLAAAEDLPAVAEAFMGWWGAMSRSATSDRTDIPTAVSTERLDLRRFRDGDPALDALERAFRLGPLSGHGEILKEVEDVCPVVNLSVDGWDGYLATLPRTARHEIRRKLRRAERFGPVRFEVGGPDPEAVEQFIELHDRRWGAQGLFPATPDGDRTRNFIRRLAVLEQAEGPGCQLQVARLWLEDRLVFAGLGFDDGETCYFYNAGMDPRARDLASGVVATAHYLRYHLELGHRRFDFLRGNEPYKYEWGAVDEPIHRLVITSTMA